MNTTASTRPALRLLVGVRDELRERRQARAQYRALERDLSSYTNRSEVDDLLAMLGDKEDPEAEMIRDILARNLQRRQSALAS